jgi:hypothetical protein
MKRQIIIVGVIAVVSCLIISGCTTSFSNKDKFIGSWKGTYSWAGNLSRKVPATITFSSDGTYAATLPMIRDNGTWDISDGILIKTAYGNPSVNYTYSFSNDDTSLIFISSSKNDQWNVTRER